MAQRKGKAGTGAETGATAPAGSGAGRITNAEIAAIFRKLADLLDIEGANPFRVRAYRQAALVIDTLPEPVADMIARGEDLTKLPWIGRDLAEKIRTIAETGHLPLLDEVMRRTPPVLTDLLQVRGLGPRRVEMIHEHLGIETLDDLEAALRAGRLRTLPGFGPKTEAKLLHEIEKLRQKGPERRWPIGEVREVAEALVAHLRAHPDTGFAEIAGSYRRRRETVGDLDMVAVAQSGPALIRHFTAFRECGEVVLKGITRSTIILRSGLHVDLRVVPAESCGTTLAYFTGARNHTIALRKMAVERGWKLNEYGLFDASGKVMAGARESDLYKAFAMAWIPPELREMRGEMEAARKGALPDLVAEGDLRGDLLWCADPGALPPLIEAAQARGLAWAGVLAAGPQKAGETFRAIDRMNESTPNFRLLKIAALEIPARGTPDLAEIAALSPDLVRAEAPPVSGETPRALTARWLNAIGAAERAGLRLILARLTSRRLSPASGEITRGPAPDLDTLLPAAAGGGHLAEVCQHPAGLGLDARECRLALEAGLPLALCSRAASPDGLGALTLALWQARRGWAETGDLANTAASP